VGWAAMVEAAGIRSASSCRYIGGESDAGPSAFGLNSFWWI
jgi:hypothetical protein